jgi:hypothetical protein
MRIIEGILAGVAMGLIVGGLLAFIGGHFQVENRTISGLGPFNGVWEPAQIRFFGAIIASIGSGLFTGVLFARKKN